MLLFTEYCIGEKTSTAHYRKAQLVGLIPIFFALLLMSAQPTGPGPGLFAALGISLGLQLILWGSYALHGKKQPRRAWGRDLVKKSDRWFPLLVFGTRMTFFTIILIMLWLSLIGLEFPSSLLLHILFVILLVMLPIKGLAHEATRLSSTRPRELADEFARTMLVTVITLFIAISITNFILPKNEPLTGQAPPALLIVWVPAFVILLCSHILFLDHLYHYRKRRARVQPPEQKPSEY